MKVNIVEPYSPEQFPHRWTHEDHYYLFKTTRAVVLRNDYEHPCITVVIHTHPCLSAQHATDDFGRWLAGDDPYARKLRRWLLVRALHGENIIWRLHRGTRVETVPAPDLQALCATDVLEP